MRGKQGHSDDLGVINNGLGKLTRAGIPMCPKCDAELEMGYPHGPKSGIHMCLTCSKFVAYPDHGYRAPDVTDVVDGMKNLVTLMEKAGDGPTVHSYELYRLMKLLKEKPDANER